MSEEFHVENGLRQDDALSPMLFVIALESLIRTVLESNTEVKIQENTEVTIVEFADIMILTELEANLKTISDLIETSENIGLIINDSKAKYMILLCKINNQTELVEEQTRFERVENLSTLE